MRTTIDRIGKYELRAVLARTPMSTVYDGWDGDIARRVAIKLMPLGSLADSEAGEAFARFKRGAQAAGQLNHPNIVSVYDYGETADFAYLVMEFVDGFTLKKLFDDNQRFDLTEVCRSIGSILGALQYSHDQGVVHRDVKPANIMYTKNNQIKITDFGIARLEDSEMTQAGMVIGTPAYMSPEQFLGEKIDLRTDIYSTGVVLYHMLTGERPYEGNLATIMHKVLYGSPLAPSRVSTLVTPAVDAVVTKAMARNRDDRFSSAAAFNAALQAARTADRSGGTAVKPSPQRRPKSTASLLWSSYKLGFIALAAVLFAGAGGAFWYLNDRTQTNHPGTAADTQAQHAQVLDAQAQREQALKQAQEQARINQLEQARAQQQRQAQLQQEQDRARLQQQQDEQAQQQQAQQQEQARLQQQERTRIQQEQTRLQQQEQARLQQQERTRVQQQEQARLQQEQDDTRLRKALEQVRQQAARDQARQNQPQEKARPKQDQDQPRQDAIPQPARQPPNKEPARPPQDSDSTSQARATIPSYPVTSTSGAVGLVCESVTADTATPLGLDSPQGMIVTGVLTGGAADKAGIRLHDVILKIKGSEAHNLSALSGIAANEPSLQSVPVEILSHGTRRVVQLGITQIQR